MGCELQEHLHTRHRRGQRLPGDDAFTRIWYDCAFESAVPSELDISDLAAWNDQDHRGWKAAATSVVKVSLLEWCDPWLMALLVSFVAGEFECTSFLQVDES